MATGVSDEYRRHVSALIVVLDIYPDLMKDMISNTWPSSIVVKLMNGPTGKQLVKSLLAHQQNIVATMNIDGYSKFDVNLMYKIISHFGLVDEPSQGWGNKPKIADVNQGDDIERMRLNRNYIVHRPRLSITDNESQEFFAESVNIAFRMDSILKRPSNVFQNRIKDAQSVTVLSSTMGKQYLDSCPNYKGNLQLDHGRQLRLYITPEITHQMENNDLELTECILYVRDPAMHNSSTIVKILKDVIHQINDGKCKIKIKSVEEGSLIIYAVISGGLTGIDVLCEEITVMFNYIFEFDYINKNCGPYIEVVLAESSNTTNEGQIAAFESVTSEPDLKSPQILKMNVTVHTSSFHSAQTLCDEVNGFASSIFNHVDTISTPQNGSSIDVIMVVDHNEKNLLLAAGNGNNKAVEECLKNGTDVNCQDENGWTPLHWAAQNGHADTVYLLISKAASINSQDRHKFTPLHCAAGGCEYKGNSHDEMKRGTPEDHIAIVDYLLSMGSAIDSKDFNGRTPYDLATDDEMKKRLMPVKEGIREGLPLELINLDKKSVNDFIKLLKEDSYQHFELPLMLHGEQGTGKSTIARFLVGMRQPLFRKSTDGIDLYTGLAFFDDENNIWLGGKQNFTFEDIIISRAMQVMKKPELSDRTQIWLTEKEGTQYIQKTDENIFKQQGLAPESSKEPEQTVTEAIQRINSSEKTDVQKEQTPLVESEDSSKIIKNPVIIEKLKSFFGVNKEVQEIKISVTKDELYDKSRKVAKKEFHKRKIVPVTIWDFGGHDVFYSTHQTFLTYRAVYMLVLDGSRTLDEPCKYEVFLPGKGGAAKTQKDYLRFWINTIITYSKGEKPGFPKIMVILTHKDKLKGTEIEKRREEIFGEISKMFDGSPIKQHLAIEDQLFVNARNNNDPEMQKIKYSLIRRAQNQPTWGEKWPKCFIPLELEIQCLVKKGIAIISIEDMKKVNDQQAVRPLTDCELKAFLKFQHSVGKILYFDEPYLDMHIIISPTFLIDAFKSIITDKQFCQGDKQKEEAWYTMGKKGIILKQTVATIWNQKKYIHFFNAMRHLLGLMTHLDILVEARRYDTNHCRIPSEFYYVPSMLRKQDTTGYLLSPTFSQRNIALCFETSSSIIPPGLSFRFISYCLGIWGVKIYGNDNEEMLFHRSAVFTIDPLLDLYIRCEDERVIVRLVHARSRSLIMKDLASSIRECLFAALHKISQLYVKTSSGTTENVRSFDVRVCCSSSTDPCSIAIQDISDVWICCHKIEHGKDLVLSWFTEKRNEKCESFCPVTDPDFLKQTPTDLHLLRLALVYETNEVRELVMALGLPFEKWDNLCTYSEDRALLKFRALKKCVKMKSFTFENLKAAAEREKIQNFHTICKVLRDEHVNFDREPEKWDLVVTDEDIDKLSPLVGNMYLHFLVELGLSFSHWEEMEYSQKENDLVKLNRKIMEVWRTNCKNHNVKPVLRTLGQAFENIGINIKNIENMLFN